MSTILFPSRSTNTIITAEDVHQQLASNTSTLPCINAIDLGMIIQPLREQLGTVLESGKYILVPNFGNSVADLAKRCIERVRTAEIRSTIEALNYLGNTCHLARFIAGIKKTSSAFLTSTSTRLQQPAMQKSAERPSWTLFNLDPNNPVLDDLDTLTVQQVAATIFAIETVLQTRIAALIHDHPTKNRTCTETDTFSDATKLRIQYQSDLTQPDGKRRDRSGRPMKAKSTVVLFSEPDDLYMSTSTQAGSFGTQIIGDTIKTGVVLTGSDVFKPKCIQPAKGIVIPQ